MFRSTGSPATPRKGREVACAASGKPATQTPLRRPAAVLGGQPRRECGKLRCGRGRRDGGDRRSRSSRRRSAAAALAHGHRPACAAGPVAAMDDPHPVLARTDRAIRRHRRRHPRCARRSPDRRREASWRRCEDGGELGAAARLRAGARTRRRPAPRQNARSGLRLEWPDVQKPVRRGPRYHRNKLGRPALLRPRSVAGRRQGKRGFQI